MKKIKTGTIVLLCGVVFFTVLFGICLGLLISNNTTKKYEIFYSLSITFTSRFKENL